MIGPRAEHLPVNWVIQTPKLILNRALRTMSYFTHRHLLSALCVLQHAARPSCGRSVAASAETLASGGALRDLVKRLASFQKDMMCPVGGKALESCRTHLESIGGKDPAGRVKVAGWPGMLHELEAILGQDHCICRAESYKPHFDVSAQP